MQPIGIMTALLSVLCVSDGSIFREDFQTGLKAEWRPVHFEGRTRHEITHEGTNAFLQAVAASSASGMAVKIQNLPARGAALSWKWKIHRVPPGGSEDELKTFDHSARLFVAFKTRIGPPRSINYIWANQLSVGKTFHHPSSSRSRFIVLESGRDKAGQWISEQRNIAQDWKKLFGDDEPPAIVAVGLMTDSDGTRSTVVGFYDDIELRTNGQP